MKPNLQGMTRAAGAALLAGVLMTVSAQPARAQTQPDEPKQAPEVQQLKDRVKQLEQTVEELKGQIDVIEGTQKAAAAQQTTAAPVGEAIAAGGPAPVAGPAPAPKQEEKKTGGTFEVYGFAMLDAGYQFGQNHPDWFDTVRPTKLPAFEGEFTPSGHTYFSVRQSRLGARSTTPTKYGDLKTTFEFELFGTGVDAGQTTFRLRHAYGELGHFGAGQYWTVFGDVDAFPNTTEYWGPNGLVWYRNVQVRWMPYKGRNSLTLALERPGGSGDQGVLANRIELSDIRPKFAWPDLTGNVRVERSWGHFQASGILRSIRWIDANHSDAFDFGGSAVGWGLSTSTGLNFGKNDVGRFQFTYGEGIENYMNDAPVDVGAEFNPGNPNKPFKGVALPVFGMSLYLDHRWNKSYTSALGYSLLDINNSNAQSPSAFRRGHYASGNLLYNMTDRAMVGGEFIWGRRENFSDGWSVNDYRTQFSFKYNFSKVFEF
ncbi:MAG: DcaP family trimeric outer membrane transporter [Pyrinomonadaceae bacterium]